MNNRRIKLSLDSSDEDDSHPFHEVLSNNNHGDYHLQHHNLMEGGFAAQEKSALEHHRTHNKLRKRESSTSKSLKSRAAEKETSKVADMEQRRGSPKSKKHKK
jgi:hypothetical protein